jgi:hypothetical protein
MPQETNLNVSPYFDDFDADKNYYKVLFKPGYPVQARELTTLQSILQNQTESFGKHIFKDGSVVIPGQLTYDNPIDAIEIESEYNGAPVSLYFDQFVGKRLRGDQSGVTAEVFYSITNAESERTNYTLYVRYLQSGGENLTNKTFVDGETLLLETPLTYGNFTVSAGQGICNAISTNSTSKGSSVKISSGVYFVRGFFAKVQDQRILLDQYGTSPSYKVGFNINERIVTSDEDESLLDNSQGFSNYAAPGADRFQLELELTKKPINDNDIESFIEILRVKNGVPEFFNTNPQYNLIRDELAKRTFDSSGDYYVKPFTLFIRDSLNDRVRSDGVYFENQTTVNGDTPSEDMMVYQIGPGKAYVNGYDVETISARLIDVQKPRTTASSQNQVITYNAGSLAIVNNAYGSATIGLGTTGFVSLMDSRIGETAHVATGTTIGVARVYDFVPESDYVNDTSRLNVRLFDIQTYTTVGLTTNITQSVPALVKGKTSNATGYLKSSVTNSNTLTLYQVSGNFSTNESILINGINNGRLINSVRDYSIDDVKSIYSQIGISTFNADLVLSSASLIAPKGTEFRITSASGGISTVSAGLGTNFVNTIKSGDIISYQNPNFVGDVIFNKVNSVSAGGTNFTIAGVTTVSGVCVGRIPSVDTTVSDITILRSTINSEDASLLTKLSKDNVSSISLENNEIVQRRLFSGVSFTNGSISVIITDPDIFFSSFDEDRFVITYSDGSIEPMRSDKFSLDATGKILTFNGLSKTSGTADIITTVKNTKPNSKIKKLNKANTLVIDKSKLVSSGIGTTTLNDALTYSQVYGVRVQDEEICLNVPDVVRVLAVYESSSTSNPSIPKLQLTTFTGPTNNNQDFAIGEQIVGRTSGAVAVIVSRVDTDKLEYVYLNSFEFSVGEVIDGKESNISATISSKIIGSKNITQNYILDDGQRDTIYDYSRIIRKSTAAEPTKRLKIVFQNYTIDSSDTGEFITVNSYPSEGFKHDVGYFANSRLTDYVDIRPRVAEYTLLDRSPFEFQSRNFSASGQSSRYALAPAENIILSYSYYLPRIDKVYLNQDGTFEVSQGSPQDNPLPPAIKSNALDIATIYLPPYVYDVQNVNVDMSKHKRYRMEDIALLENRIERVEKFTTLSMIESKTENFTIKDAETGLDRFKCGFFVDNFSSHDYHDLENPTFNAAIDTSTNTLRPIHYTTSLDLQLGSEVISGVANTFAPNKDHSFVTDLGSANVKKTGDLVTLNYTETSYIDQPNATKAESIFPFTSNYWNGTVDLYPSSDNWIDENAKSSTTFNTLKENTTENVSVITNLTENKVVNTKQVNVQSGINAFDWIRNAKSVLTNVNSIGGVKISTGTLAGRPGDDLSKSGFLNINGQNILHLEVIKKNFVRNDLNLIKQLLPSDIAKAFITETKRKNNITKTILDFAPNVNYQTSTTTKSTSNSTTIIVPPEVVSTETASDSASHYTEVVKYLRSRNIEFDVNRVKPVTRFYPFLEGIDVKNYVVPKLLEVTMLSGTFQVGETIESDPHFTTANIKFRLCTPNHKVGPHNTPTETFTSIPYNQQPPEEIYSASSSVLNVDTRALQEASEVNFYGSVAVNMTLIGKTSGAIARISDIRLVSDNQGRLIGSLFIPDPNVVGNPKWINGENTFTIVDTESLSSNESQSFAEVEYTTGGVSNVTETNILTTRYTSIVPTFNKKITSLVNTPSSVTAQSQGENANTSVWETHDPLAQSFYVKEDTGIFLTSVDVFFKSKDSTVPVTFQIRPLIGGVPSNVVVPFSEVTISSNDINISKDGSVATNIKFPSPVYLSGPQQQDAKSSVSGSSEYAFVILTQSSNYEVFISEVGSVDLLTDTTVSEQPFLGSLFKSQNGSTWSPSDLEDLKFKFYRAEFASEGLVKFFNPKLSYKNKKVTVTPSNNFLPLSKKIVVGLGSTGYNSADIYPGLTITQGTASATLTGIAGSITIGTGVTVINSGIGYTNGNFSSVSLITETGFGQGAVANITVASNAVVGVTITTGGFGYQVGDSLLIPSIGKNVGFGAKVVVSGITTGNAFILDNVQGTFSSGITTISYTNSSGITTFVGAGVTISSITEDQYYDGLHMKVYHKNHGMHSPENYAKISEFRPLNTSTNSTLSANLSATETTTIGVVSSAEFTTFEGKVVSGSNPGYVIIGDEIIKYTSISGNNLTTLTRSIDGSESQSYIIGDPVYKYEFNGVSLRRINKTHNFAETDIETHPITLDSYHIKIDVSDSDFDGVGIGSDRSNDLYFEETVQTGESGTVISSNIPFEAITPNVSHIIPAKTNLVTRVRTFSGRSIGGNESAFNDEGFATISLNSTTYFATPKAVYSEVNEERLINGVPGNRSLTFDFLMSTNDSRVSPVIDTINTSAILTSNLINNPVGIETVTSYAFDRNVRSLYDDTHSTVYISKPVRLQLSANSLKVLLTASRNSSNDIRILYQLFRDDSPNDSQSYTLFPGYSNYSVDGNGIKKVTNSSLNDGSEDSFLQQGSQSKFADYEYSVDDLPNFNAFAIKVVMAGTNQATPPVISSLRAIATVKPNV